MPYPDAIKRLRNARNLTQEQLAMACGFPTQSRIANYERGKREPSLADAALLAEALGVTQAEVLDLTYPAQSQPARLTGEMLASAYRMARQTLRSQGQEPDSFDPEANEIDAAIFAEAMQTVISRGLLSDRDELDFVVETGGRYAGRFNRQDGGAGGAAGEHEAGAKAKVSRRRRAIG